jgi:hypothetical protein
MLPIRIFKWLFRYFKNIVPRYQDGSWVKSTAHVLIILAILEVFLFTLFLMGLINLWTIGIVLTVFMLFYIYKVEMYNNG